MDDERRTILERVASGDLSPEQAASELRRLRDRPVAADTLDIRLVRVRGIFRSVEITGDPQVRTAVADGPHSARTEGDAMIFEDVASGAEGSYMAIGPLWIRQEGSRVSARMHRGRHVRIDEARAARAVLRIRMNPDLPLEVELTAGTLNVRDVRGPVSAEVTAGSARLKGVRGPVRLRTDAGSTHVRGCIDRGDSEVRCTAGKVVVELEPGSDVRVTARATLGKVVVPDDSRRERDTSGLGGSGEAVIGGGRATLDLEATMGSVVVVSRS